MRPAEGGPRTKRNPVRAEYEEIAEAYDARWHRYNRKSLDLVRPFLSDPPPGRLLDLGSGTGSLLSALHRWEIRPRRYVGVDLTPVMLQVARRKASAATFPVAWVASDVVALPFTADTFDVVVSASALHYWPDPPRAFEQIRTVLRPGGRFLLVDWCRNYVTIRALDRWLRWRGRAHHRTYTAVECAAMLRRAGFRVREIREQRIDWLWGLMIADAMAE